MSLDAELAASLAALLPGAVEKAEEVRGETVLQVDAASLHAVCRHLRDRGFNYLTDVTAVDTLDLLFPSPARFTLVYHLERIPGGERIRLKAGVSGDEPVADSVSDLWPAAVWGEREVYDLFGIRFHGHPDLRRIMMPDDWEGHPLRKDYPLQGFPGQREV